MRRRLEVIVFRPSRAPWRRGRRRVDLVLRRRLLVLPLLGALLLPVGLPAWRMPNLRSALRPVWAPLISTRTGRCVGSAALAMAVVAAVAVPLGDPGGPELPPAAAGAEEAPVDVPLQVDDGEQHVEVPVAEIGTAVGPGARTERPGPGAATTRTSAAPKVIAARPAGRPGGALPAGETSSAGGSAGGTAAPGSGGGSDPAAPGPDSGEKPEQPPQEPDPDPEPPTPEPEPPAPEPEPPAPEPEPEPEPDPSDPADEEGTVGTVVDIVGEVIGSVGEVVSTSETNTAVDSYVETTAELNVLPAG